MYSAGILASFASLRHENWAEMQKNTVKSGVFCGQWPDSFASWLRYGCVMSRWFCVIPHFLLHHTPHPKKKDADSRRAVGAVHQMSTVATVGRERLLW